jgi:Acyl-CoA hydrolase
MTLKATFSQRLIKLGDLNHHHTFFAGRCSEWFLESSYFAIAQYVSTENAVLFKLHGIDFNFPIFPGDIVTYESKVVANGNSTLTVYTKMYRSNEPEKIAADGFATFSYLDENHHSRHHGIVIEPETEEDIKLNREAKELLEAAKNRAKALKG